jgi:predicted ATPase/class 3 adenylate cyclase
MQRDLSIYIPTDRRHAMANGSDLPDQAHGAALFADISGFTPLTEALAEELGPKRGAEEITKQLNVIYAGLIAQVDRYGGSVIGFSGDAITCWFDEGQQGQGNANLRAAACAFAMQAVLSQYATITTPAGAVIALSIKVAIAAGPARRFCAGMPEQCLLDAIAGATVARMAEAERNANKGEVVLSREVAEALGAQAKLVEWRGSFAVISQLHTTAPEAPWPALPPNALPEDQVRAWLLPRVYEREQASQESFLAELRPTVALFLRFEGIDYDNDPDAGHKLNAFVQHAQRIAQQHEGTLIDLTIGDKGSYLYLSFGAPVAHDDDPLRAVAAALALRTPPENSGITEIQIGISMGRMRAGPIGGPTRRTYGVLGDEVNLSARLMSQAQPGQILISNRVALAIGKRYTLRHIGSVGLKGKLEPIEVWQVLGLKLSSSQQVISLFPTPLVGREAEWDTLMALLAQAKDGAGQLARVVGAAGVGKSHLVAELAIEASLRGWAVSAGACQSTTQDTAYAPWRQIFRALMGLEEGEEIDAVEAFVMRTNPNWQLRLPLLGDLLGIPIPDNGTTAAFEPRLRQSALFDLVTEIVEQLSRARPLLLVQDDAHWLDESSKGLLLALARSAQQMPVMLIVVHRPLGQEPELLPELDGLPNVHALILGELTPVGVAALIGNKLGGSAGTLALSLIQSETQGNPFYVEEVVNTLREAGHLNQRDDGQWALSEKVFKSLQQANALVRSAEGGGWVLAPNASLTAIDLGLPDSIQGVVLSRIDRLPEADKLTLKVAGVVGRTFALDLVAEVHPSHPGKNVITQHAQHLEARDFTKLEAVTPRLVYIFKHNVTRDVAYDTLLFEQRRQLHRAMAAAIESLAPEDVARIGLHAYEGEDWPRALRYQLEAGQQAKRLFANREGIEHLRKALRAAAQINEQDAERMLSLHQSLAEMLITVGEYDEGMANLQQALALGDADAQARACRWMAYAHEFRSEFGEALSWIERGLGVLGERETPFTAELYAIAGLIDIRRGNYDQALAQCDHAIAIAQRLDAPAPEAMAQSARGLIAFTRGNSASAVEDYQRAITIYERINNVQGKALAYNSLGNAYQNLGEWTKADANLKLALATFNETGDAVHYAFASNNLGEIARYQGRYDAAVAYYGDALRTLEQLGGSAYVLGVLHMNLGSAHTLAGDLEQGQRYLALSEGDFTRAGSKDYAAELKRHVAVAALRLGNEAESRKLSEQSLEHARQLKMRGEEGITLRLVAELAVKENKIEDAINTVRNSIAILVEAGVQFEVARSRLLLAQMLTAQGKSDLALAELELAIPVFRQLDALPDLIEAERLRKDG